MDQIQIIIPAGADMSDQLDGALVTLTQQIAKMDEDLVAHGFLGGEFGYGAHVDNAVFQMHPFCWCDGEDCPWCHGCSCPDGTYHYLVDGKEVTYDEWMGFFKKETGDAKIIGHEEWMRRADIANSRRSERHDAVCDFCTKGRFPEKGSEAGKSAPNFWHKKSGLKVWWYKYIGRGMEVRGDKGIDLSNVFNECLAALRQAA